MTETSDLSLGSFTEHGPWRIHPESLQWAEGLGELRAAARAEVPVLMRRRRVPPLGRFLITGARLTWALGAWWCTDRRRGGDESIAGLSRRLRRSFERLGTTYIKLGQIISSGQGLFPDPLVEEFKLLRDRVPAEPFATVRRVVEEELGQSIEAVFSSFEETPVAAASIAQVHRATLRSGEHVVVKVQRPQVQELVRRDIAAMSWIAPLLIGRIPVTALANPPALVEVFAETILEELDFRLEAENMLDIARVFAETDQRIIVVPRPHPELVTRRLLVMERLDGFAFDDVAGVRDAGIDTTAMLRGGLIAFLEGALFYGVFHGDLHGGNLFIRPDGRIALLDYGMTGRLEEHNRLGFVRLLVGAGINDVTSQLEALRDLGALPADTDLRAVITDLGLDKPLTLADPNAMSADELVGELQALIKALLGYGARLPKSLMLFVKNMLFLDGAIALHAPEMDLFAEVMSISAYFTETHGERLAADAGIDPDSLVVDLDSIKESLGLADDSLSYADLMERRKLIRSRVRGGAGRRGRRAS
ncbi:MAG TPA: AarF/UbiB family protein [Acidimicrobiales bacterium]|nr:AarF/UbiB family protein [Acidimicrobiales bacterium]